MAVAGHGNYVIVVVLHVGGFKACDIKLVLQREAHPGKTCFSVGSILPNEEHIDASVRELFEENDLTQTVDDLTMLNNNHFQVMLTHGKRELVYVYATFVPVSYVTANLRPPSKVSQLVATQSTINYDGRLPSRTELNVKTLNGRQQIFGLVDCAATLDSV
jgi:8-oxo-dGTP pyrophosphatase MutT (NUDIX family)